LFLCWKKAVPFSGWREKKGTKGTSFVQLRVLNFVEALHIEKGTLVLQRSHEGFLSF